MHLLILFGVGVSTGLAGAMIPGPLVLYTVSEAFRDGQLSGIKIALGHLAVEATFATLAIIGLHGWLQSEAFRQVTASVGGVGLAAMGGLMLANVRRLSLHRQAEVAFRFGPWLGGAFFSLASPGFLIWWATIGTPVFLQGALAGAAGITAVAAGHALADLVWCWFVAFSVERGRAYCTDQMYRILIGAIAAVLIALGIGLVITQHGGHF